MTTHPLAGSMQASIGVRIGSGVPDRGIDLDVTVLVPMADQLLDPDEVRDVLSGAVRSGAIRTDSLTECVRTTVWALRAAELVAIKVSASAGDLSVTMRTAVGVSR